MVMVMWVRVENNVVVETTDLDPSDRFHPDIEWVYYEGAAEQGMIYEEGTLKVPSVEETIKSNADIETLRRIAYADPITGSDRFFLEAWRMKSLGVAGWEVIEQAGVDRYLQIQEEFPWNE